MEFKNTDLEFQNIPKKRPTVLRGNLGLWMYWSSSQRLQWVVSVFLCAAWLVWELGSVSASGWEWDLSMFHLTGWCIGAVFCVICYECESQTGAGKLAALRVGLSQ